MGIWGSYLGIMDSGSDPPPLPPEFIVYKSLVASSGKKKGSTLVQQFVKKVDIPIVELPVERHYLMDLNLSKYGLIGQFMGLWPSPKEIDG